MTDTPFNWENFYLKEKDSEKAFSTYAIHTFTLLGKKYEFETYPYIEQLQKNAKAGGVKDGGLLEDLLRSTRRLAHYYYRLAGIELPPLTKQEIINIRGYSAHITNGLRIFLKKREEGDAFATAIKKTESEVGIDVEELKRRHGAAYGYAAQADKDRSSKWLAPVAEAMQSQAGIKSTVLASVFGAYAPIADIALTGAGKLMGWQNELTQKAELKGQLSDFATTAQDLGELPEGITKVMSGIGGKGIGGSAKGFGTAGSRAKSSFAGTTEDIFGGAPRSEMKMGIGGMTVDDFKKSLFNFYDQDAKKAWWTRSVLETLQDIAKKTSTGDLKKDPNLLQTLGDGLLVALGAGLANPLFWGPIAIAGATALGYWIGQLPAVKDFLSGEHGVFTAMMGKKESVIPQANKADPQDVKQKKVQTLSLYYQQQRHMNAKEAYERANKELGWTQPANQGEWLTAGMFDASGKWTGGSDKSTFDRTQVVSTTPDLPNVTTEASKQTVSMLQKNHEAIERLIKTQEEGSAKTIASFGKSFNGRDPYDTGNPSLEAFLSGNFGVEE